MVLDSGNLSQLAKTITTLTLFCVLGFFVYLSTKRYCLTASLVHLSPRLPPCFLLLLNPFFSLVYVLATAVCLVPAFSPGLGGMPNPRDLAPASGLLQGVHSVPALRLTRFISQRWYFFLCKVGAAKSSLTVFIMRAHLMWSLAQRRGFVTTAATCGAPVVCVALY